MSELVEFSKQAQASEYHLITYDIPVKPSIFLHYTKDNADLILEDNLSELKKAVTQHPKSMVIVKRKNMSNSTAKKFIQDNFSLIGSCKKYEFYKNP